MLYYNVNNAYNVITCTCVLTLWWRIDFPFFYVFFPFVFDVENKSYCCCNLKETEYENEIKKRLTAKNEGIKKQI